MCVSEVSEHLRDWVSGSKRYDCYFVRCGKEAPAGVSRKGGGGEGHLLPPIYYYHIYHRRSVHFFFYPYYCSHNLSISTTAVYIGATAVS